jgi:hypothetical protein
MSNIKTEESAEVVNEGKKESFDIFKETIKNPPPITTLEQKDAARKKLSEFNRISARTKPEKVIEVTE